jgi:hypothetical protein
MRRSSDAKDRISLLQDKIARTYCPVCLARSDAVTIGNLTLRVEKMPMSNDLSLDIPTGETHVFMSKNGLAKGCQSGVLEL